MPAKIKARTIARSVRKGVDERTNPTGSRRKGSNRATANAPTVISNSIFALTLKAKPGIEVLDKVKGPKLYRDDDNYYDMYRDLLKCFQHALKIVTGETSVFDPLVSGLEIGASLTYVSNGFKENILPKGFEYNVDKDPESEEYFFTIYKVCDFQHFWHAFETKHIVKYLFRRNKKLHDLYLQVINSFMSKVDIMSWWNGGMGYAEFQLDEQIANWDDCVEDPDDPESQQELEKAQACLEDYRSGDAHRYEALIHNAKFRSPDSLLRSLSRFNQKNPAVIWMKEACLFLKLPGCMNDFIYHEYEENGGEGVRFDQQAAIIWDWDDYYTNMQEESLDAEAQGCGVIPPVINFSITKNLKEIDFDDLYKRCSWPVALTKLYYGHQDLIATIKPKQKKNAKR